MARHRGSLFHASGCCFALVGCFEMLGGVAGTVEALHVVPASKWGVAMDNSRGSVSGVLVGIILISLVLLGDLFWLWRHHSCFRHQEAIVAAFNDAVDPFDESRYESFWADGGGACCMVVFPLGMSVEIRSSSLGAGRHKMNFDSHLMCPAPAYDPSSGPDTPESREVVPCDDRWRLTGCSRPRAWKSFGLAVH